MSYRCKPKQSLIILAATFTLLLLLACGTGESIVASVTPTVPPDEVRIVRSRVQKADQIYGAHQYDETVRLEGDTLLISAVLQDETIPDGFDLQEYIAKLLELSLVDCTKYFLGSGTDGCKIKEKAEYKYVRVEIIHPNNDVLAYVKYTVGNEKYFSGIDGTRIPSSDVFDIADEQYLNSLYYTRK